MRSHRRSLVWMVGGLLLAALVGGIAWRVLAPAADSGAEELQAVRRALRRHDLVAARTLVDRCLLQKPNDEQALLLAAQVARRSDDCPRAEHLLTLHEEKFGETKAGLQEWLLLGVQQGDFGSFENQLLEAINRRDADSILVLEALAKGYRAAQRPEAMPVLQRLLMLEPDHVPALLLRGQVLNSARQTELAERDFRLAVDLAPDYGVAQTTLAGLLSRLGRTRDAIYHYELGIALEPDNAKALLGIARALCDDADLAEAQKRLDELLAHEPDNVDGLVERARLYLRQGKPTEAEPLLERAVRTAPNHREAQQLYLTVQTELGRKDVSQCAAEVARLLQEDAASGRLKLRARDTPGDQEVRWELWRWSVRNDQTAEGLSWLLRILMTDVDNNRAQLAIAEYFERSGQPRRAAEHRALAARSGGGLQGSS